MSSNILLGAVISGILAGAASNAQASASPLGHDSSLEQQTPSDGAKHACKGQNACKGQGGCKTDKHACKSQNACKGQGGCKTDGK